MDDIEEKRVFGNRAGAEELLVAAGIGVLSVDVSGENVGQFGVVHRCDPTDVAAAAGLVAVATDEDVLLREPGSEAFEPAGFGPAAAVGVDDSRVVAATPDRRVAWLARVDGDADDEWGDLGALDAEVRAIDGDLVAAADGVHRLPGLEYVGLDDVRDVAVAGPLVAAGSGLYSLGNGWMEEVAGAFDVVATDGSRAHAATAEVLIERRSEEWREVELPVDGSVVDVAHGEVAYAVTEDGALLAEGEDGWRVTRLGVEGVVGCGLA